MLFALLLLFSLALTGVALFYFFRSSELNSQLRQASEAWRQKEEIYTSELDKLEKIRHIPDIIERARKSKLEVVAKLAEAQRRADEIVQRAVIEAQEQSRRLRAAGEEELEASRASGQQLLSQASSRKSEADEALRLAKWQ